MPKETNISPEHVNDQRKLIGDKIFTRRCELEISAFHLAGEIGVKESTIYKIEQGEFEPKLDMLIRIGIVLNFKIEFYYENGN